MKYFPIIIFTFFLTVCFGIGGHYLGGFLFLKLVKLPENLLSFSTLEQYYYYYSNTDDKIKNYLFLSYGINAVLALIPSVLVGLSFLLNGEKKELYGSARFANDQELKRSGLIDSDTNSKFPDVLLGKVENGKYKDKFISFEGQQFIGLGAPTRSGKGVGVVIPNLLHYRDSVVVLDIKMENFIKTAGFRKSAGQDVFLWSPSGYSKSNDENLTTHRWNPLTYIRRDEKYRVADTYIIANMMYPKTGSDNDIWNDLAANLFVGFTLYMLDLETKMENSLVTLPEMYKLTSPEIPIKDWMQSVISSGFLSEETNAKFNDYLAMPDNTAGSAWTSFVAPLSMFADPICAYAVSGDSFDLRDVRKKRMSIYLGITPNSLATFSKLLNLFFAQLVNENTRTLPENDPTLKYQCLLMLDEFTSMGRINTILKSVAYTAGYNIRYLFIYQSFGQLADKKAYDKEGASTILENCAVQLCYPPKKVDDECEKLSKTLGYTTFKSKSVSHTYQHRGNSKTVNTPSNQRALMLPQEIVDLGNVLYTKKDGEETKFKHKAIMINENLKPLVINKIVYFDEPVFIERSKYSEKNQPTVPLIIF